MPDRYWVHTHTCQKNKKGVSEWMSYRRIKSLFAAAGVEFLRRYRLPICTYFNKIKFFLNIFRKNLTLMAILTMSHIPPRH